MSKWKTINTIILIVYCSMGASVAVLFGSEMDTPWELDSFLKAPVLFGAMSLVLTWFYKLLFGKRLNWKCPSYDENFFSISNVLKAAFFLGAAFLSLGFGWGLGDLFQGRGLSNNATMCLVLGCSMFITGMIQVKLFSNNEI